jgi:hypothetical protein
MLLKIMIGYGTGIFLHTVAFLLNGIFTLHNAHYSFDMEILVRGTVPVIYFHYFCVLLMSKLAN